MLALLPVLGPLLVNLLGLFLPGGKQQAAEPSTAVGVAELAAALSVFHLSHDLSTAAAAAVVALLGVFNVYRREHAPAAPPTGPQ